MSTTELAIKPQIDDLQDQVDALAASVAGAVDQSDIDATVAAHSADTTAVHGIADTARIGNPQPLYAITPGSV